jgi:hypothetical protein
MLVILSPLSESGHRREKAREAKPAFLKNVSDFVAASKKCYMYADTAEKTLLFIKKGDTIKTYEKDACRPLKNL